MIRPIVPALLFAAALCFSGCCGSGQPAASAVDVFSGQNTQFELQHADHVKKSSDAVRGYLQYRNR